MNYVVHAYFQLASADHTSYDRGQLHWSSDQWGGLERRAGAQQRPPEPHRDFIPAQPFFIHPPVRAAGSPGPQLPCQNLFFPLPTAGTEEHFEPLLCRPGLRIERIVSHCHASPPDFWFDQTEDEWVMLARGSAELEFDDGERLALSPGDWLLIPAGRRHRVAATGPDTVWLAIHMTP